MSNSPEPIVSIHWCAEDLMSEFEMSHEDAVSFLSRIASILEERSIEVGWSILHQIVSEVKDG